MKNIRHHYTIEGSADRIYKAITEEEGLQNWWTAGTTAKPEVGFVNTFRFGEEFFNKMKVTNLEENKRVEWECVDGPEDWIGTNVWFDLEQRPDDVIVRFGHDNWKNDDDFFAMCNFHWARYMNSIKSYCESGTGNPFRE